jgi:hypothetical protein
MVGNGFELGLVAHPDGAPKLPVYNILNLVKKRGLKIAQGKSVI